MKVGIRAALPSDTQPEPGLARFLQILFLVLFSMPFIAFLVLLPISIFLNTEDEINVEIFLIMVYHFFWNLLVITEISQNIAR